MKFEWDARKAETNLYKHGISFDLATAALRDPFLIELVDDSESYGEDRIIVTAMAFGLILIIVYTLSITVAFSF